MARTIGAIKEFMHFLTDDPAHRDESPRHVLTVLDVLEPRKLH
ncbi:MAG TPA: hypothetical protein VK903_05435 [Propionicimonas sp.]|nr:hypothetical protein [Propionicimonas sp.]